jgi:hypothetical protein
MHKPLKEMEMKGQVGLNLQDGGTGILFLLISVLVKTCPWDLRLFIVC